MFTQIQETEVKKRLGGMQCGLRVWKKNGILSEDQLCLIHDFANVVCVNKVSQAFSQPETACCWLVTNAATSALPTEPRDSPGSPSKRLEKGSLFNFALDLWSLEIGRTKFLAQCPGFLVASLDKGGTTDVFLQIRENCIPTSSCVLCLWRSPETVPTQR